MRPGETRYMYVFLMTIMNKQEADSMTFHVWTGSFQSLGFTFYVWKLLSWRFSVKKSCHPSCLSPWLWLLLSLLPLSGYSVVGTDDRSHLWRTLWSSPVILQEKVASEEPLRRVRVSKESQAISHLPSKWENQRRSECFGIDVGLSPRVIQLGQLRVLHSYFLCRVSQRNRVLQLSRTLRGLKARARPGKAAFIPSFVSDPILSMNQTGITLIPEAIQQALSPIQSTF